MPRMSIGRHHRPWAALAVLGMVVGCSDGTSRPVEVSSTIQKATGGEGQARQSTKAKEASGKAAKSHPKIY